MARGPQSYTDPRGPVGPVAGAVDVSAPKAGFYRFRMRSGSPFGGVEIVYGPPLDPITGEEMDRSWRWYALFNDEPIDFDRVWPACAADRLTELEYRQFCARQQWARQHAPRSGYADPRRRIDLLSPNEPLPF